MTLKELADAVFVETQKFEPVINNIQMLVHGIFAQVEGAKKTDISISEINHTKASGCILLFDENDKIGSEGFTVSKGADGNLLARTTEDFLNENPVNTSEELAIFAIKLYEQAAKDLVNKQNSKKHNKTMTVGV